MRFYCVPSVRNNIYRVTRAKFLRVSGGLLFKMFRLLGGDTIARTTILHSIMNGCVRRLTDTTFARRDFEDREARILPSGRHEICSDDAALPRVRIGKKLKEACKRTRFSPIKSLVLFFATSERRTFRGFVDNT